MVQPCDWGKNKIVIINSAEGELENWDIYQDDCLAVTIAVLALDIMTWSSLGNSIKTALKHQVLAGMERVRLSVHRTARHHWCAYSWVTNPNFSYMLMARERFSHSSNKMFKFPRVLLSTSLKLSNKRIPAESTALSCWIFDGGLADLRAGMHRHSTFLP